MLTKEKKGTTYTQSDALDSAIQVLVEDQRGLDIPSSVRIKAFAVNKEIKAKGSRTYGSIQVLSSLHRELASADVVVLIEEPMIRSVELNALLHHLLCSLYYDGQTESMKIQAYDFQGYAANIKQYGDWAGALAYIQQAATMYQLSLLDKSNGEKIA
jgi:Putative phage metallopeptidase